MKKNNSLEKCKIGQLELSQFKIAPNCTLSGAPNSEHLADTTIIFDEEKMQLLHQLMKYAVNIKFIRHNVILGQANTSKSHIIKLISNIKGGKIC